MRITFFLRITNLPHAEFGKFYNFIWKMASFRQFGKAHLTPCPSANFFGGENIAFWTKSFFLNHGERFPTLRAQLFEGRLANPT